MEESTPQCHEQASPFFAYSLNCFTCRLPCEMHGKSKSIAGSLYARESGQMSFGLGQVQLCIINLSSDQILLQ